MRNELMEKLAPYSCLLNIDEVYDIEETWEQISEILKEGYIVLSRCSNIKINHFANKRPVYRLGSYQVQ